MNKSFGTIIKETRKHFDINQDTLANICSISRRYLSDIENDLVTPSSTIKNTIQSSLTRFDNSVPLETLIDYVKVRFPTLGVKSIIENVLGIKYQYIALEELGLYSYDNYYFFGDMVVHTSKYINKYAT